MKRAVLQISVLIQFSAAGGSEIHSENRLHRLCDCAAVPPRPHARRGEHSQPMMVVTVMKSKFRNSEIFLRFFWISFDFLNFLRFFLAFVFFFGRVPEKMKKCWQHCPRKLRRPPKRPKWIFQTMNPNGRFLTAKSLEFRIFAVLGSKENRRKIEGNRRESKENIIFLLQTR